MNRQLQLGISVSAQTLNSCLRFQPAQLPPSGGKRVRLGGTKQPQSSGVVVCSGSGQSTAGQAGSQLLSCTGQMWSSLTVIHEKWGFYNTNGRRGQGWGRLTTWEAVLCTVAAPLLCVGQAQGSVTGVDVLLLPRCVHGICRWALSTDDGISIRSFYHLELKSPRRLCKYKLYSSKDVAYYWLNTSG